MYPMDDLSDYRISNLFGSDDTSGIDNSSGIPAPIPVGPPGVIGLGIAPPQKKKSLLDSFVPKTGAEDKLNELLNNVPQMKNPGILNRIMAGLSSLAYGPDVASKILTRSYDQQMNNWLQQANVAGKLATDESQSNNVQRQILATQQSSEDKDTALTEKAREADNKQLTANRRADAYVFKNSHPNWVSKVDENGQLIFYNPQDPTQTHQSGITTDALTPDLRQLLEKDKETAAMARTQATQAGANSRNANTEANKNWSIYTNPTDGKMYRVSPDGSQVIPVQLPTGAKKVGTESAAPAGSTTTSTTTTTEPPGLLGKLFSQGPSVKSDKTTTTVKTPGSSNQNIPNAASIPVANRVAGKTQAMINGQVMTWNGVGWVK